MKIVSNRWLLNIPSRCTALGRNNALNSEPYRLEENTLSEKYVVTKLGAIFDLKATDMGVLIRENKVIIDHLGGKV